MILLALAAFVVAGLDQAAKAWVLRLPEHGRRLPRDVWWCPQPSRNRGLILRGSLALALSAWMLASAIAVGWALISRPSDMTLVWAGTAAGGAASNFADKFFRGAIIDFIVAFGKSFNLADVAIVAGIVGVVLSMV